MAQPQNITSTEALAYTKGWTSTAKTFDQALEGAKWMDSLITDGHERDVLVNFFQDGYDDKRDGSAKWDRLSAPKHEEEAEEATTHVETDGVVVAVTRHLELVPEAPSLEAVSDEELEESELVPAHEIIDGAEVEAGTPEDEVADALAEEAPTYKLNSFGETIRRVSEEIAAEEVQEETASGEWVSIASLRRLAAETPRGPGRQGIRALVVVKKGAYRRGYTAATEGQILSEAKERYLAKRDPQFLQDFVQGYQDAADRKGMGASW